MGDFKRVSVLLINTLNLGGRDRIYADIYNCKVILMFLSFLFLLQCSHLEFQTSIKNCMPMISFRKITRNTFLLTIHLKFIFIEISTQTLLFVN